MSTRPSGDARAAAGSGIDFVALDRDGYVVLPGLVSVDDLGEFEDAIARAGERLAKARGIDTSGAEPLSAVIKSAGRNRAALFDQVKRLWVIERLAGEIGRWLETQGLFSHRRIDVPVLWPTLKADLPGETDYSFPLHQDYATTRSASAWRLWIPLRDANPARGTMKVAVGSHRHGPYRYVTANTTYPHVDEAELARYGFEIVELDVAAGTGVLFDPRMVHGSVPNRSTVTKYVMLLHVQDLSTYPDADDPESPFRQFFDLTQTKIAAERKARGS